MKTALKNLRKTVWYRERPKVIQQAIEELPPTQFYKFKDSGKQCQVISYEEPISGKLEDVTVTVRKTGIGGGLAKMGFSELDTNNVFGVKLNDLEPWAIMSKFYTDGIDHSNLEINSDQFPEHQECVNCGSIFVTITDDKDICHDCGYVYE